MKKVKEFYSVPEVAVLLGKSRQQVSLDCRLGKIESSKFGKSYYMSNATVLALLKKKGKQIRKELETIY